MLEARHITKKFPGVKALDDVSLTLTPGRVNAIIGENGAGKSTLMKVLSGVYTEYDGSIILGNQKVEFNNPKEAQDHGVVIIHQELNLVPHMTVMENIFLGREYTTSWGTLDKNKMAKETKEVLHRLRLDVSPDTRIHQLKIGQQQLVEIAKALIIDAKVIIMDEPTSAITGSEVEVLFGIIHELKKEGKAIAYISHKLDELFTIADDYTVLRDGKLVGIGEMSDVSREELISKMVGRELLIPENVKKKYSEDVLMKVEGLKLSQYPYSEVISFELKKGEILGLFGLMGAGRTELFEALFGLEMSSGSTDIYLNGAMIKIKNPADAMKAGLALVSEDRKKDGFIPGLSVKENMSLTILKDLVSWGVINDKKESSLVDQYIADLQIKTPSPQQLMKNLSGGNQQKVILAKWLSTNPKVLLMDEPTRGIDIHAKSEIYKLMKDLAASGKGIIMISSELPEILAVSDRVLVLCEGELTGEFNIEEATEEKLLQAAISKQMI